jgi:hypothetical protein
MTVLVAGSLERQLNQGGLSRAAGSSSKHRASNTIIALWVSEFLVTDIVFHCSYRHFKKHCPCPALLLSGSPSDQDSAGVAVRHRVYVAIGAQFGSKEVRVCDCPTLRLVHRKSKIKRVKITKQSDSSLTWYHILFSIARIQAKEIS